MIVALAACTTTTRHTSARQHSSQPRQQQLTPGTPPAVPDYVSFVAQATVAHVPIYATPGTSVPTSVLDNPWHVNPAQPNTAVPQVFLVRTRRADGWIQVLLPVRPNGTTGWIRAQDVMISPVAYKIRIDLTAHTITVFSQNTAIYQGAAATGSPATPTPVGHYYIRALIKAPDPNTVYGPYAYGLSSHSNTLSTFDGSDAETGIHGNNNPATLGQAITHGCIRIDNTEITRLATTLPLGTPVDINP